ncbi:hypothetical protein HK100_009239 [Physocladia obscura]|uniref:RRM domain-containing protein n=1 Tax=Physocladia obscura TaxID=109957 RepID=A0AAD5XMF2_9FUNG|nr:hypothetical protein HK100_009239 [Physocladia obscura]
MSATRIGDDGAKYQLDAETGGWFPVWDGDDTLAIPPINEFNPSEIFEPVDNTFANKPGAGIKRKHDQRDPSISTTEPVQPPKKKFNSSIYVSNLPPDTTFDEMKEFFSKYGIIMEDIATGLPRIKMYTDSNGNFKGDALVTYFKEESVKLAVDLLDDSDFRLDTGSSGTRIRVQQAVFQDKEKKTDAEIGEKSGSSSSAKPNKQEKKKAQKKIENLKKKLDWFEDETGKKSEKYSKIVILKHMFTKGEIDEDPTLLIDLKEEVREECEKFGEVTNVILYDHSDDGVITVRFKDTTAAAKCVEKNNGRFFGGRRIVSYLFDGKEKFKETKTAEQIQAEEEKRLAAFESWLEENH